MYKIATKAFVKTWRDAGGTERLALLYSVWGTDQDLEIEMTPKLAAQIVDDLLKTGLLPTRSC